MKENSELNLKFLIFSFIIAVCVVYEMFSDNNCMGVISWFIMVALLILASLALVIWCIHGNKNIIINYIKNIFR